MEGVAVSKLARTRLIYTLTLSLSTVLTLQMPSLVSVCLSDC